MFAGYVTPFWVRVRNVTKEWWPGPDDGRPIRLGYRWVDPDTEAVVAEELRTDFTVALAPGQERVVAMRVRAPDRAGQYILEVDIVHEFVRWLGVGARVIAEVRAAADVPQLPRRSSPALLANADPQFIDRLGRLCGTSGERALRMFERGRQHEVKIPSLGGPSVRLRGGTSDLQVVNGVFLGPYHLPPLDLRAPRVIVDLGANIGLTMAHYASLFPTARIVGVELDAANVELCRRNIAPWSDRCTVVHAAIWRDDAELSYARDETEPWAYSVGAVGPGEKVRVTGLSLDSLLRSSLPDTDAVDFLKVDIEGAELELFRAPAEWASRVRSMRVEAHPPYTPEDCAADLTRLGFTAKVTVDDGFPTVTARNRSASLTAQA